MPTTLQIEVGSQIALTGCAAYEGETNRECVISGLFEVSEFVHREPSAYQWESGVIVTRGGSRWWFISELTYMEQVHPKDYGQLLVQEREWEFAEEAR
jgi:hypothetical protein